MIDGVGFRFMLIPTAAMAISFGCARCLFKKSQMHMKMCGRGHSQVQTARPVVRRRVKDTKAPGQQQPDQGSQNPHAEEIAGKQVHALVTSRDTINPESAFNTAHASTKHIELEPLRGLASGGACSDKEYEEDIRGDRASDGRVACSNCLRKFSSDRVAVHQDICYRINTSETTSRIGINRTVGTAVGSIRRSSCSPLRTKAMEERRARRGFSMGRTRGRARAPPAGTAGDPTKVCVHLCQKEVTFTRRVPYVSCVVRKC